MITISATTTNASTNYPGTTCTLRLFSDKTFTADDGTPVMARGDRDAFFKSVNCTISAGVISIPSFTIPPTTSALDDVSAKYTAVFYDSRGIKRDVFFADFQVTDTFGSTVTWAQLRIFKRGRQPIRDLVTYTKDQVNALIAIAAGALTKASDVIYGLVRLSYPPASAAIPVAAASNDPRLAFALPGAHFTFDGDSITHGLNLTFGVEDWPTKAMLEPWFSLANGTKHNTAVDGSTTADIIARYVANDRPFSPSVTGLPGYFFLLAGINDINAGLSAATIFANLSTIRGLAVADGYEFVIGTVMPNGLNAQSLQYVRQQLNALIDASGWKKIDFARSAMSDADNMTLYQDDGGGHGLHPRAAGAALMGVVAGQDMVRNSPTRAGAALELTKQTLASIGAIGVNAAPPNHIPVYVFHKHADVGSASIYINTETAGDQAWLQIFNGTGLAYIYLTNQVPNFDFQGSFGNALALASNTELQLFTAGEARFTLMADGKIGIGPFGPPVSGLPEPDELLHLRGSLNALKMEALNATDPVWAQAQNGTSTGLFGGEGSVPGATYLNSLAYAAFYVCSSGAPSALQLGTAGTAWLTMLTNGMIGVRTTAPEVEFDVVGAIRASTLLHQGEGAVLSVSGNTIVPTHSIHHVGAGLIKAITVPSQFDSGTIYLIPDAAFTTDQTGNIASAAATAVIGKVMIATYSSSSSKWYLSY